MRHIFHEILARYLTDDQHAFDASRREPWPTAQFESRPESAGSGGGLSERGVSKRIYRELESQN